MTPEQYKKMRDAVLRAYSDATGKHPRWMRAGKLGLKIFIISELAGVIMIIASLLLLAAL